MIECGRHAFPVQDQDNSNRVGEGRWIKNWSLRDKELEFAKKIALLRKLVREGLLTEQEYSKVRQRIINIGGEIEEVPDNTQKQNKRRKRRSRINPVLTTG